MSLINDIDAALALLPERMRSQKARVLLYATSTQENPNRVPRQLINRIVNGVKTVVPEGPAVGDYQFEKGGGIVGVLTHPSTKSLAIDVCHDRGTAATPDAVWRALQTDPVLAAAFARLLYWTDFKGLPEVGDSAGAFALYLRTWRPGAYQRQPEELRRKWHEVSYPRGLANV